MNYPTYHYIGQLPVTAIGDNGLSYAIRNTNDHTYLVWHGESESRQPMSGPLAFASAAEAQRFIDDMAEAIPDGTYRVVHIQSLALIVATSSMFPSAIWTRQGDSYGYVPFHDLAAAC